VAAQQGLCVGGAVQVHGGDGLGPLSSGDDLVAQLETLSINTISEDKGWDPKVCDT
jgi:hypothetical protein